MKQKKQPRPRILRKIPIDRELQEKRKTINSFLEFYEAKFDDLSVSKQELIESYIEYIKN